MPGLRGRRWAVAWPALTAAFALHVADEATHDFLAWYNPVVCLAVLTPLIRPGRRWAVVAATAYGIVHVGNALSHIVRTTSRHHARGMVLQARQRSHRCGR